MGNKNYFIGYEYKDITVQNGKESMYCDGYHNFGWILDSTIPGSLGTNTVNLKFKRDRKIRNKAELTRLQRQFDSCVLGISELEQSKTSSATILSFIIGIIGTAFMAGSVFAVTSDMVILCIILAVPAFIGWIIPYFCYKKMVQSKTTKLAPLIDQKYDEIYDICEKASRLLTT